MASRTIALAVWSLGLFAACGSTAPARSSTSVLSPERTWVVVGKPLDPVALDVTNRFQQRGFMLADSKQDGPNLVLHFAGARKEVTESHVDVAGAALAVVQGVAQGAAGSGSDGTDDPPSDATSSAPPEQYVVGSAFYVRLEPRAPDQTYVSAVGRPTRDGVDACTADKIDAPCQKLEGAPEDMAGDVEGHVIDDVFGDLRTAGVVVSADPAIAERARACLARRKEYEDRAARVSDPRAKAGILRARPHCDPAKSP